MQFAVFAQLFEGVQALAEGVGGGGGEAEGVEGLPEVFAEAGVFVVGAEVGELVEGGGVLRLLLISTRC